MMNSKTNRDEMERKRRENSGCYKLEVEGKRKEKLEWNSEKIILLFNCPVMDSKMFSFGMNKLMELSGHWSEGRTSDIICQTQCKMKMQAPLFKKY